MVGDRNAPAAIGNDVNDLIDLIDLIDVTNLIDLIQDRWPEPIGPCVNAHPLTDPVRWPLVAADWPPWSVR